MNNFAACQADLPIYCIGCINLNVSPANNSLYVFTARNIIGILTGTSAPTDGGSEDD
jgi:hypothetical protein